MRRQVFVFTIFLFFVSNALSQTFDWANLLENSTGNAQIQRVKYDNSGNIIVFGKYFNQVKLGNGASLTTLSTPSGEAYFLAKYNPTTSNLIWARDIPVETAVSENNQVGLTTDDGNNVYVTANYQGDITIGGSTYTDVGSFFFVAKYDVDGNFLFENRFTATGIIESRDIALDINGGIYIAGHFSADVTFGSLTPLVSNGDRDIFILQLDPSGNPINQRQIGGDFREEAAGIEVEGTNDIYLAGMFQSDITLLNSLGLPVTINPTSNTDSDVFLAKFIGVSNLDALSSGGGFGNDLITDIELGTLANNIYATGYYSNDFTFQGSSTTINSLGFQDVFTISLSTDFTENWIASGGGTRFDYA